MFDRAENIRMHIQILADTVDYFHVINYILHYKNLLPMPSLSQNSANLNKYNSCISM